MNLDHDYAYTETYNPIEALEEIAKDNRWPLEKLSEEEASLECMGRWGEFVLSFLWNEEHHSLQICATSTLKVSDQKLSAIKEVLFDVNQKTWIGHFVIEPQDRFITFKYNSLMRGASLNSQEHIEDLIDMAMTEFDRFYPAFQAVLHRRKVANDVMMTMLADTIGQA